MLTKHNAYLFDPGQEGVPAQPGGWVCPPEPPPSAPTPNPNGRWEIRCVYPPGTDGGSIVVGGPRTGGTVHPLYCVRVWVPA